MSSVPSDLQLNLDLDLDCVIEFSFHNYYGPQCRLDVGPLQRVDLVQSLLLLLL